METTEKTSITVETIVKAPVEKVWKHWNEPDSITKWAFASDEWHAPSASNDLRVGGKLKTRMEAKDKSAGFDFEGTYTNIRTNELIEYTIPDGRKVSVKFIPQGNETKVVETFDAESTFSHDMQRSGWQAILENFKKLAEAN